MFLKILIDKLYESIFRYEDALNYLKSRHVTEEEISLFRIGYSRVVVPVNDGTEDYNCFVSETHKGRDFESKIVFPLLDMLGNPVGLLGRSLTTKEFKLFITPEGKYTGVFFGLFQALPLVYQSKRVFTVEGPFDFLAFRKVFANVVATLTAELTESQHDILSLFAKEIVTVFDSDKPGRVAAERAEKWKDVRTACLGWKDPDAGLKYLDFKKFSEHVKRKISDVVWMA